MASRKEKQRQNYLDGVARRPHSHSRTLRRSLEGAAAASSASTSSICPQCYPVLARYISVFKSMQHSGTELKKRKRSNPYPKKQDTEFQHHRDITKQNEWLRSNLFDSLGNYTHTHTPQSLSHTHTHTNSLSLSHTHTHTGNYLYCSNCIKAAFGISNDRLARQRSIKRKQAQTPISTHTKLEVEEGRLGDYVIMPADIETSFKIWWRGLDPSTVVDVRYPHERHGNAGRTSNSAKTSVQQDFLEFVDLNSQPNGRSADSTGPTRYFLPKFTTIQTPKPNVCHYEERVQRSVVGEFNRAQRERGGQQHTIRTHTHTHTHTHLSLSLSLLHHTSSLSHSLSHTHTQVGGSARTVRLTTG